MREVTKRIDTREIPAKQKGAADKRVLGGTGVDEASLSGDRGKLFTKKYTPERTSHRATDLTITEHGVWGISKGESSSEKISVIPEITTIKQRGEVVINPDHVGVEGVSVTYSDRNTNDKYTEDLEKCVALLLIGDSTTAPERETVSQLFHITPGIFDDLGSRKAVAKEIIEFLDTTEKSEAQILGGLFAEGGSFLGIKEEYHGLISTIASLTDKEEHRDLVSLAREVTEADFGIEPSVRSPKRNKGGKTHVYFKNDERKLIIVETGDEPESPHVFFKGSHVREVMDRLDP